MSAAPTPGATTYVLVHGAGHGGWCWRRVSDRLIARGHRVLTPTLTGLGERHHLLTERLSLDTFEADIINVIEAEELANVILVGHSFAGITITGVAERMPERLRHLVYLDALIVPNGLSAFDMLPAEYAARRRLQAQDSGSGASLPALDPRIFGITEPDDIAWLQRRLTPHPRATYEEKVRLRGHVGNGLPKTYVACTRPPFSNLVAVQRWVQTQSDWDWREIAAGHDAMITAPAELAEVLMDIGPADHGSAP